MCDSRILSTIALYATWLVLGLMIADSVYEMKYCDAAQFVRFIILLTCVSTIWVDLLFLYRDLLKNLKYSWVVGMQILIYTIAELIIFVTVLISLEFIIYDAVLLVLSGLLIVSLFCLNHSMCQFFDTLDKTEKKHQYEIKEAKKPKLVESPIFIPLRDEDDGLFPSTSKKTDSKSVTFQSITSLSSWSSEWSLEI